MPTATGSVSGPHSGHRNVFYGLSTCVWCKRTRQFLEEQGVAFDFVYVDLLVGGEREEAMAQVRQWNPALSFPTLVVDDAQCVVGAKPDQIREVLGL